MTFERKIFICSPYAPKAGTKEEREKELKRNMLVAQAACMYAMTECAVPCAPHLYFPQFLNDEDPIQREYGQGLGLEWLEDCDELWVIGREITEGMKKEIEKAEKMDIPVRHYVNKRNRDERILDAIFYPDIDFREMTL